MQHKGEKTIARVICTRDISRVRSENREVVVISTLGSFDKEAKEEELF